MWVKYLYTGNDFSKGGLLLQCPFKLKRGKQRKPNPSICVSSHLQHNTTDIPQYQLSANVQRHKDILREQQKAKFGNACASSYVWWDATSDEGVGHIIWKHSQIRDICRSSFSWWHFWTLCWTCSTCGCLWGGTAYQPCAPWLDTGFPSCPAAGRGSQHHSSSTTLTSLCPSSSGFPVSASSSSSAGSPYGLCFLALPPWSWPLKLWVEEQQKDEFTLKCECHFELNVLYSAASDSSW